MSATDAPSLPDSPRAAAALAIRDAATRFPDLNPTEPATAQLTTQDAALARAIHRTVLQRWLTLEHALNRYTRQPLARMEPAMRSVLLTAAAQLLFMHRLPAYAVIHEAVELARRLVRPRAAGLANAVLRKLAAVPGPVHADQPWVPAPDRLPIDAGTLMLNEPILPGVDPLAEHLAPATSHPPYALRRWLEHFDLGTVLAMCSHNVVPPPVIVAVEPGFDATPDQRWLAHEQAGFIVWQQDRASLAAFLAQHPARRVQDPASAAAISTLAAQSIACTVALDYCAGRGTKTRQLATQFPQTRILATDTDAHRRADLAQLPNELANVRVLAPDQALTERVDLLLLDVPCSNTAVLARRPEARYRLSRANLRKLRTLQRRIITQALPTLEHGGHLLYSTCSIEPEENAQQLDWLLKQGDFTLISQQQRLPHGQSTGYRDGSYHALLRRD